MDNFSLLKYLFQDATFYFLFKDPSTEFAQSLINLHHWLLYYIIITCVFVFYLLARIVYLFSWKRNNKFFGYFFLYSIFDNKKFFTNKVINSYLFSWVKKLFIIQTPLWYVRYNKFVILNIVGLSEYTVLEIIWTLIPSVVIVWILIPSFTLLYSVDSILDPLITVIVVGHQWYWSYEISENSYFFKDLNINKELGFDSNLLKGEDLVFGTHRLLEVNNRLVLPVGIPIQFLITSGDVLHSWAIPEMGIKVDAIPGRLNQVITELKRPGVFYGQCSELCGVEHGFMPIVLHVVPLDSYLNWLES